MIRNARRVVLFTVIVFSSNLVGACTPVYDSLRPEDQIQELARLKVSGLGRTVRARVGTEDDRPAYLAVHEIGPGTRDRLVVLLHGALSDSDAWRFMIGRLAEEFDVMAIDLPGCGQSDKPDPREVGEATYTPEALGRRVLRALRGRLAARGAPPGDVTLVGHCLGGMIWLRTFSDPDIRADFADVLDRVDRMVLMAPVDTAIEKAHGTFERIAELTEFEVEVGNVLGILREECAIAMKRAADDPEQVPREEADRLLNVLRVGVTRRAAQAMIVQAVPFRPDRRPDWEKIEPIVRGSDRVSVPSLIIWGARDETFPLSMGYKLAAELPDAWLHILPNSMHALVWERPESCAELIREFIDTDGSGMQRVARSER